MPLDIGHVTFIYGYKSLEKEFNWIGRKTIRGYFYNTYKYFVKTPYLKISCYSEEAAWLMKFRLDHV